MKQKGITILDNGLRLFYCRVPAKVIHAKLRLNVGSMTEPSDKRGLAHIVEHVGFNGTKTYPTSTSLESAAADIALELNASTSFRSIDYPFDTLCRDFSAAASIIADIAFAPSI